jgi:hypothetical protein
MLAINLLRAINTAEFDYRYRTGSYVSWDVLQVKGEFTAPSSPRLFHQVALAHYANAPQIPPGWSLRLNVSADGKAYDLLLEDLTDKACGYAAGPTSAASSAKAKPSTATSNAVIFLLTFLSTSV